MVAPRKYSDELRERATRMAIDARKDPETRAGAYKRVADQLGVHPEALRTWVKRAEISTYYAAKTRPESARSNRDRELTEQITTIHHDNYSVYGVRKVYAEMHRQGTPVARCTVARLMKEAGLKGIVRSKSPRTTRPAAEIERPADLVERRFVADAPNQLWVADITYCRTFSGWVYAA